MNRRSFLKTGSMAGATAAWGRLPWPDLRAAEMAAAPPPSPSSVDKPMRWAQLTPVESDPRQGRARKLRIADQKPKHQVVNKLGIGKPYAPRAVRCVSGEKGLGCFRTLFPEDANRGLLEAGLEIKVCLLGRLDHCLHLFSEKMFDPARGKYVLYGRTLKARPEVVAAWQANGWFKRWFSGRAVARVESPDFVKWDFSKPGTAPLVLTADLQDPPGTEIYSMRVFPHEGIYIGRVQVLHATPDDSALDVQLAVSRDRIHFTRVGDRGETVTPPMRLKSAALQAEQRAAFCAVV